MNGNMGKGGDARGMRRGEKGKENKEKCSAYTQFTKRKGLLNMFIICGYAMRLLLASCCVDEMR